MATESNDSQFKIVAGPPLRDILLALELRHEGREITFGIERPSDTLPHEQTTIDVKVDHIGIEDGSGNNWLLKLSFDRYYLFGELVGGRPFGAYYNTNRREGWVRLVEKGGALAA